MPNSSIPAQTNLVDIGYLQIQTLSAENQFPIQNARVAISYTGQPDSVIETLETDSSGQTENIALEPSALAGMYGPVLTEQALPLQKYLNNEKISPKSITHLVWATGGSMVPKEEMSRYYRHKNMY